MSEDSYQQLLVLDERIELRVKAIRNENDWWLCKRGCDHCCRHLASPPELSRLEWMRVDEAVAALNISVRSEIKKKINLLLMQIASNNMPIHIVCPYLDENSGSCLIYDARPIICRIYGYFVARDGDFYCKFIETEVSSRGDSNVVWGNAEAIYNTLNQISGEPIPFEVHYSQATSLPCIEGC